MNTFQVGDRVNWEGRHHDAGTVRAVEGDTIQIWWDNGDVYQYANASEHALITLVGRIPNPGGESCFHGGVLNGKHCPICLKEER